jgi:hypothetical protein
MNRIRNAYLQLEPELEPYFVTSKYDDDPGVLESAVPGIAPVAHYQAFVAAPGVVAMLDSVVAGAAAGIAGMGLDVGIAWSLALGGTCFAASLIFFAVWARGRIGGFLSGVEPLFPSPAPDRD